MTSSDAPKLADPELFRSAWIEAVTSPHDSDRQQLAERALRYAFDGEPGSAPATPEYFAAMAWAARTYYDEVEAAWAAGP